MRLAFSVLLLTMCISAFRWPEYGANALHERNGHVGDEMNTLFEKILNITNAFKVHKALAMLHAKIGKTLELSEEMMTSLYQRLKTTARALQHIVKWEVFLILVTAPDAFALVVTADVFVPSAPEARVHNYRSRDCDENADKSHNVPTKTTCRHYEAIPSDRRLLLRR
ncbi:hypothetical protein Aduo_007594 [Ancylostoma duodenale]